MIRLALRVRRQDAEAALAQLLDFAPAGVEEVDLGADGVEYAVYGSPGELPDLPALQATVGDALVKVTTTEIADDWHERWRAFHRPIDVGDRLHVRPPWEPPPTGDRIDVVIEPGRAFGTGTHATTRLCLELLQELPASGALVDVGCGSGVLSIAAAKLGFGPVIALDHERESVRATAENALANGVEIDVRRFDLRAATPPSAPTVVANLLRPLLLALRVPAGVRHLIAGGLLVGELDEVSAAFALREHDRAISGEWGALLLCEPSARRRGG